MEVEEQQKEQQQKQEKIQQTKSPSKSRTWGDTDWDETLPATLTQVATASVPALATSSISVLVPMDEDSLVTPKSPIDVLRKSYSNPSLNQAREDRKSLKKAMGHKSSSKTIPTHQTIELPQSESTLPQMQDSQNEFNKLSRYRLSSSYGSAPVLARQDSTVPQDSDGDGRMDTDTLPSNTMSAQPNRQTTMQQTGKVPVINDLENSKEMARALADLHIEPSFLDRFIPWKHMILTRRFDIVWVFLAWLTYIVSCLYVLFVSTTVKK